MVNPAAILCSPPFLRIFFCTALIIRVPISNPKTDLAEARPKPFSTEIIIVGLLKFLRSPAFDDLLDVLQGFFGFVDGLVEQFGSR